MADEVIQNVRRAVDIAPDLVDGYISEIGMMCKEYFDRRKGNLSQYVKFPKTFHSAFQH